MYGPHQTTTATGTEKTKTSRVNEQSKITTSVSRALFLLISLSSLLNHHVKWPKLRCIWERKRKGGNLFYYLCLSSDGKVYIDVAVVVSKRGRRTVSPLLIVVTYLWLYYKTSIIFLVLTTANASWTKFSFDKLSLYINNNRLSKVKTLTHLHFPASRCVEASSSRENFFLSKMVESCSQSWSAIIRVQTI